MSPAVAPVHPATTVQAPRRSEGRRAPAPRLRVVSAPPSTRTQVPFAAACAGLLALTLVGLLMLNITLSRSAYEIHELELQRSLLTEQQQGLQERLAAEAAPGRLAERATGMGMVTNPNPAMLRLSDGAVLGAPAPAPEPPPAPEAP